MARDEEIGVKISLKERAKFQKDVRDSAADIESLGGAAERAEEKSGGLLRRVAGGVVGVGKAAIGAGVALGAAFGGTAVTLGVQRLMQIEDATAKLDGLGHSAEAVEQVMDDALASVKGTAFGLGDAATIAAGVVAAGVEPGEDLERTLKLIADTAQIAGTDIASMGSVFNKVLAKGKLGGDELMQLSDRGLPVLQWLQEELGATADEVKEMVSRGEVDFETFSNAVEKNIGGAALRGGDTTRGAFANMFAAVGRFGAELAGPVFEQAQGFFVMLTGWVDEATEVIGPFAERIGEFVSGAGPRFEEIALGFKDGLDNTPWQKFGSASRDALDSATYWFGRVDEAASWVRDTFNRLRDSTETMFDIVETGTEGSWVRLKDVFWQVRDAGEALSDPILELGTMVGEATAKIGVSTWEIFLTTLELLADVLTTHVVPFVERLIDYLGENQWIVDAAVASWVLWSLTMKGMTFAKILIGLGRSTAALATNTAAWVVNSVTAIKSMGATIAILWMYAWDNVRAFGVASAAHVRATLLGIRMWARSAAAAGMSAITTTLTLLWLGAQYVWIGIKALAAGAKMALMWIIGLGPIGWAIALIVLIAGLVIYYWDEIVAWTKAAWTTVSEWTVETFNAIKDWIIEKFNAVIDFFSGVGTRIASAASGMWDGIKDSFRNMLNWVIDLWNNFGFTIGGFQLPGWLGGGTSPSFTISTPNIPRLHQGGDVTGGGLTNIRPNEELVMLPQASRVVPLPVGERVDQSILGGDGESRPLIAKVYLDRREIAEAVFEMAGDVVARR
ncbi:MAG: tape measure protein [Dermatophilaceae bacterium]